MKTLFAFGVLAVLCAAMARADGIPYDRKTGKVTTSHSVLTLDESQVEEVEALGTLTLSPAQWKQLRAVGPRCPKRFENVLPKSYESCLCGVEKYVIQLSTTTVAVPHYELGEFSEYEMVAFEDGADNERYAKITLRADRRGQFYAAGVLLPFEELLRLIGETKELSKGKNGYEHGAFWVELPIGVASTSVVMKERLDRIYVAATNAGWDAPNPSGK